MKCATCLFLLNHDREGKKGRKPASCSYQHTGSLFSAENSACATWCAAGSEVVEAAPQRMEVCGGAERLVGPRRLALTSAKGPGSQQTRGGGSESVGGRATARYRTGHQCANGPPKKKLELESHSPAEQFFPIRYEIRKWLNTQEEGV
eukprot:EG_transcript_25613